MLSESIDHSSDKTYIITIGNTATAINKTAPHMTIFHFVFKI